MPDDVRLAGRLPKSDTHNGLRHAHSELLTDPHATRVAVVIYGPAKVVEDYENGGKTVYVHVLRWEDITIADDKQAMARLLMRAFESRSGQAVLPLDTEQEINDLLAGLAENDGDDQSD